MSPHREILCRTVGDLKLLLFRGACCAQSLEKSGAFKIAGAPRREGTPLPCRERGCLGRFDLGCWFGLLGCFGLGWVGLGLVVGLVLLGL